MLVRRRDQGRHSGMMRAEGQTAVQIPSRFICAERPTRPGKDNDSDFAFYCGGAATKVAGTLRVP